MFSSTSQFSEHVAHSRSPAGVGDLQESDTDSALNKLVSFSSDFDT